MPRTRSSSLNLRHGIWLSLHAVAWVLAALVVQVSTQAHGPQPAWVSHPSEGPSIVVNGEKLPLAALQMPDGKQHPTTYQWHGVPPHVQPTLADKLRFEAIEDWLVSIEQSPGLRWITRDGRAWPISWQLTGWSGLPTISWVLLISSLITWHLALWNLGLRPRDTNTRLYAMAGMAFTAGNLIRAWLCARAWALPTWAWDFQFWVSHFCGLAFLGCLLVMVLRIPQAAISPRMQAGIGFILLCTWLADVLHLVPGNLSATYHQPMAVLALLVLLAQGWMAWQHRDDAAYWAALRWFLIVFLMAVLPPVVLYSAWAMGVIGSSLYDPVLVAPALGYCALSALLHRNRLIQLESWRSRATSLWVAGIITLGLMTSLVVRNDEHLSSTLGISLLALPWIYVVVRSILTFRTPAPASERLQAMMGDIMDMAATRTTREDTARQWIGALQKAFTPQRIHVIETPDAQATHAPHEQAVQVIDNGQRMRVPHLDGQTLVLEDANARLTDQHRTRPFTPTDAELATAMWRLMSHGLMTRESYQQGIQRERQRIASDLHDTIGGRLLHLSQTATSAHQRQYAISTLADLRSITRGLSRDSSTWGNVLADMRHQLSRELDAVGVVLDWQSHCTEHLLNTPITAEDAVAINCVVSELVRNALAHARTTHLTVQWHMPQGSEPTAHAALTLSHDCPLGNVPDPSLWEPGLGINSIRRRIGLLEGTCTWTMAHDMAMTPLHFHAQWPLRQTTT